MSAKEFDVQKKYKLVAPEGGWGYMIAIAVVINLSVTTMFAGSFGLLYKDFMEEVGFTSRHVTIMSGLSAVSNAIAGFVTSPLLSLMSVRMLMFVAAIIMNAGVIGSIFVNSMFPFFLCVGILPGIGLGIQYNLCCTILNEYFVEKRLVVIGLTQSIIGLITMLVPMCLKWSLQEYGYRGTLLIVSGITLNNFFGVALIQPVENHMKKVEIVDNEMNTLLVTEKEPIEKTPTTPVVKLTELTDIEENLNEKPQELDEETEKSGGLKKYFDSLLDKSLRRSFLLSCVCMGPALCVFADMIYTYMLPQALYAAQWDQDSVALAISLMGFGDLAMRVIFIFFSAWLLKLGSQEAYLLGVFMALISRLGALWFKSVTANMFYIALAGAAHCCICLLIPVVIADAVPPHKFTAAMGIFMLLSGIVNMILGPAIGAVRDLTNSYGAAFYLIASCFAMIALFWIIELIYKKNKHKRVQRREYLKQKQLNKR
ncbi:monocarboxylate transporter 6-like [Anticarsia gemmatalis]|uniref:monocarboxylate transporter 6-like n=1 Tax=Anticarsia gemmatalis TaxID=129554 RepID=UPI003F7577FE